MIYGQKILALGAHPDDIEFGCLGFLLKAPEHVEKHILVASLGSPGDPSSSLSRRDESLEALEVLKPKSVHIREQVGLEAKDFQTLLQLVTSKIAELQPDLILTLGPHDTHQEHRILNEITMGAARRSRASILNYGILSNTLDFRPTFFADIGSVREEKRAALKKHRSQQAKYYMTDEYFEIFHSHNYASLHSIRYCEAFEIVRIFMR